MEGIGCGLKENSKNYYQELQESIVPKLMNVVSGFSVGIEPQLDSNGHKKPVLDARGIASKAMNAEYNPKRLNAVVMRIREPKTTALIFPSGRVIVTGAKDEGNSKIACRKFTRIIQKLGYPAKFVDWKVLNMVGMVELPFKINLCTLSVSPSIRGLWEPEIFPACVCKILRPKTTLLIFQSGKIVILGFKERGDMDTAYKQIFPVLVEFKKDD